MASKRKRLRLLKVCWRFGSIMVTQLFLVKRWKRIPRNRMPQRFYFLLRAMWRFLESLFVIELGLLNSPLSRRLATSFIKWAKHVNCWQRDWRFPRSDESTFRALTSVTHTHNESQSLVEHTHTHESHFPGSLWRVWGSKFIASPDPLACFHYFITFDIW